MLYFSSKQINRKMADPVTLQQLLQCCFHIDRNVGLDVHPQREIKLKKAYEKHY